MTSSDYPGAPTPTGTLADPGSSDNDGGVKDQARQAAGTASDEARNTAGTAAEEGKHVAGVAKGEAQQVAAEARAQAQNVLSEAMSQVEQQSRTQRDRLVDTLRTFGDDLEQMASQGGRSGMATDMARQVAGKTRDLSSRIDGREPSELLEDVRDFARRKPGMFLLGAVAAGIVAGRVTKGVKADTPTSTTGPAPLYDDPSGTAASRPVAGAVSPEGATGEAFDTEVGAEPWVDNPSTRGAL